MNQIRLLKKFQRRRSSLKVAQSDIAEILCKHYPSWMCYHDIAKHTDLNRSSVLRSLRKLSKYNEVQVKVERLNGSIRKWVTYYRYNKNDE